MKLNLYNDTIHFADDNAVFVKPICDAFNIDYDNQTEWINKDYVCKKETGKKPDESLFGNKHPRLTLSRKGFLRWIHHINPAIVRGELQEKFKEFQANVFDYLYEGNLVKKQQLEDLRLYSLEIVRLQALNRKVNKAIKHRKQLNDMCLQLDPKEWDETKKQLKSQGKLDFNSKSLKS